MDRRRFIKSTLASSTLPFWLDSCIPGSTKVSFPVYVHNDMATGHHVLEKGSWQKKELKPVQVIVVGGGIAGLSAAYSLHHSSYNLYELSDRLGGSSSAQLHSQLLISQGAHYDLEYPHTYGEEVLKLLESLRIISYQPWNKMWSFADRQHLIPQTRRQRCYDHGTYRDDVIPSIKEKADFIELMTTFSEKMIMPTRLIDPSLHHLNGMTFWEFLSAQISDFGSLKPYIDYHMKDDWGAPSDSVSALAGIHYFACRPYYRESVNLFSPPEGNAYFANKMSEQLENEKIKTGALVSSIEKTADGYSVEVLHPSSNTLYTQSCEQVIYAGQKHPLKYVAPDQEQLFDHEQAPWMVVSFICEQESGVYGFWQNEYLGDNESFLGFIDSSTQAQASLNGKRVFTAYYCLKPGDKNYLAGIEQHKNRIIKETQQYIEEMLEEKIRPEAAYIKVMGHAMPIPKPGYLLKDANSHPSATMIYAGVDNGRLPLLFEALDSGVEASKLSNSQ